MSHHLRHISERSDDYDDDDDDESLLCDSA